MAVRHIQIEIEDEHADRVAEGIEEHEVLSIRRGSTDGLTAFRVVVDAGAVESLMDPLQSLLAELGAGYITVFGVEAFVSGEELAREDSEEERAEDDDTVSRAGLSGWLTRISREELLADLSEGAQVTPTLVAGSALASVVAAVGLARDDPAVLVGAMVIAPLLGPQMALGLASTLGDLGLAARAARAAGIGMLAAVLPALVAGLFLELDREQAQTAARSYLELEDFVLATAAGVAGTLAALTGLGSSMVGVMVAAALLPPIVVFAMLAVQGDSACWGALFLVLANVVCLNLAAVGTFYALGVRPRKREDQDSARHATLSAVGLWLSLIVVLVVVLQFVDFRPS